MAGIKAATLSVSRHRVRPVCRRAYYDILHGISLCDLDFALQCLILTPILLGGHREWPGDSHCSRYLSVPWLSHTSPELRFSGHQRLGSRSGHESFHQSPSGALPLPCLPRTRSSADSAERRRREGTPTATVSLLQLNGYKGNSTR